MLSGCKNYPEVAFNHGAQGAVRAARTQNLLCKCPPSHPLLFPSPPQCEKCNLHFRHKSQLRLHLRQKHGAITNTKVQYRVSTTEVPPELPKAC